VRSGGRGRVTPSLSNRIRIESGPVWSLAASCHPWLRSVLSRPRADFLSFSWPGALVKNVSYRISLPATAGQSITRAASLPASSRMRTVPEGRRDIVGGLLTAVAALLFGTIVTLGRSPAVRDIPVSSLLAVRFGTAAVVLAALLLLRRQPLRPAPGEGRRLILLGAVGYAVESAFFFLALGRGTAATVTLLFYTYPVWVALLAAVLGLGLPSALVGGALVAAVAGSGIVVASSGGLDITALGIVFALASAVTISLFLLGLERWVHRTSSLASSMWIALCASLAHATYAVVSGTGRLLLLEELVPVLSMGVLTSGAFLLLFLGVRRLGAVRASIISSLEPVAAAALALIFLEEALRAGVLAGGVLILGGAIAATLARGVREPEDALP
jgi:drug/metabolite transporter (DMT)-like permease